MLDIELDVVRAVEREKEKNKHRNRRKNNRKYNKKINDLKYINSNRNGLININTGKRMYNTKKNQLKQKSTNKRARQDNLMIRRIVLSSIQKNSSLLSLEVQNKQLDCLTGLNHGEYKKIKTKNSFDGDKDIWKEPWLAYKPADVYKIPKFNTTRDENGIKPIEERKVGA